jgi:gas vesicle protein
MNENNNDFGAFLAGFVIGGLVGAATALILAPQSGEQTRGQISHKSQELYTSSGQRVQHYRQIADEKTQDYRGRAEHLIRRQKADEGTAEDQPRIVLVDGEEHVPEEESAVDDGGETDS